MKIYQILKFVFFEHPIAIIAIFFAFGFIGFQASAIFPAPEDLAPLKILEKNGLALIRGGSLDEAPLFPLNAMIIPHLFLRANTDAGAGVIGFLAYLSIGFSTYALSRRYAWPPTAFTVTLITLSFPRLVFLATSPGFELVPAASSLFCILAIYRSLERPNSRDLIFWALGLFFSISGKSMCLTFPAILAGLSCILFIRRHGKTTWTSLLKEKWKIGAAALLPVLVFSQVWLFIWNIVQFGGWLGNSGLHTTLAQNNVLLGAVANLVRYLFQTIHLTAPVEIFADRVFNFSITGALTMIYHFLFDPLFGSNGAAEPFAVVWTPSRTHSWFGPFGILFVFPSIIIAILRGHRRLKAIALALAGYVYVTALAVPWTSGNAQYFTVVFACGGFCVSFLLPPWRFTKVGKQTLQVISILLLFYACLFNTGNPLIRVPDFSINSLPESTQTFSFPYFPTQAALSR